MTPRELAELGRADPSRLRELLIRYAQRLTKKGRLPSYVSKTFVGVKSFLRFNHIPFDDFPGPKVAPDESLREERVPTRFERVPSRERVSDRTRHGHRTLRS